LFQKNKIRFIDFEYSWYGNEIFDVASFITERVLTKVEVNIFLDQFNVDRKELRTVAIFLLEFWARWAHWLYKETKVKIYKEIYKEKKKIVKNLPI
jgi:thiamine kinase-like enzyme